MDREDCLDDGLKWRGRVSDDSDSEEDVFGTYAERTRGQFDDFVSRVGGLRGSDSDEDDDADDDEDDPLGGLVTIGNLDGPGSVADASDGEPSGSVASDDFMKQLEEMIERDMPKVKITDEYQKVLDAVDASEGGLVGEENGNDAGGEVGEQKRDAPDEQRHVRHECEAPNRATPDGGGPMHDGILLGDDDGGVPLPDLGAILGRERKDRDVETLEEMIGELAVDEDAAREKQRRGTFFYDVVDTGDGGEDALDGI